MLDACLHRLTACLLSCLLALAAGRAAAEEAAAPATLTRAALAADADALQRTYEALHPGLYRYNTPAQMATHFDALRQALDHDQPLSEAFVAFSLFAAKVRCGHTYANFLNQPEAYRRALFEANANRVPFEFRWLDGRMVVTRNLSAEATLVPGTEILAIEAVAVNAILEKLMGIARADGHNDAKRRALLEVRGEERYETFDVYLPLLFPQVDDTLALDVRVPGDSAVRRLALPGLTHAQRQAARHEALAADAPAWTLRFDGPMAILRMPGWALYDSRWDWQAFLQRAFERMAARKTATLTIDLRGNEGGLGVGDVLLAHLIARDTPLPRSRKLVRYRKVPDDLAPMLDTWDPTFKDWGDQAIPYDDAFFSLTRWEPITGERLRPILPRFTGRTFVLVDASNSSATFEFAQQAQRLRLATLVGRPTGGNQRGINGSAFFFLRLPHSRIELDLPLVGQFPVTPMPDAGLEPDILTLPDIASIASGEDLEMRAVRKAIAP